MNDAPAPIVIFARTGSVDVRSPDGTTRAGRYRRDRATKCFVFTAWDGRERTTWRLSLLRPDAIAAANRAALGPCNCARTETQSEN
ncbi:MAG: hypothetical protein RLW87_06980 [Alphaproteobacteria bacterium]